MTRRTTEVTGARSPHGLASTRCAVESAAVLRIARILVIGLFAGGLWPTHSLAQEEVSETSPVAGPPSRLSDVLSEGTLQTDAQLFLSDSTGKPMVVPGTSLGEYLRITGSLRGEESGVELPPFVLEHIRVRAQVSEEVASVESTFQVKLGAVQGSADVLLRLADCQLTESPIVEGEAGQSAFQVSTAEPGYRWLLVGPAGSKHSITLKGLSRVTREADRRRLNFSLPAARSTIEVLLPANAIDERVRDGVLEREETTDGVKLTISSRGGEVSLSWRDRESTSRIGTVEARSDTTFDIVDPRQPWRATTNVNVRWYGEDASNELRIQLPQGARWRTFPSDDFDQYRISMVMPDPAEGEPDEPRAPQAPAVVQLENTDIARNQEILLPLEWEWQPNVSDGDLLTTKTEVPAPTISDVDLAQGTIDCILPGSYSVIFREGQGAQLLQQVPVNNDVFRRQHLRFGFSRQPFDLEVTIRREQSLPTVRPVYQVSIDRSKLVLTAWFDCSFDTSQQQMEIGLLPGDWIIQENTAKVLSDPDSPFENAGEVLRVRRQDDGSYAIKWADMDAGNYGNRRRVEQVWRVVAERSWTPDENNALEFQVPQIIRGRAGGIPEVDHGSGVLLVTSDSNLVLHWREARSNDLLSDSFSTEYQKYVRDVGVRKPLVYRFQNSVTAPKWAGRGELLPQQVSVEHRAELDVLTSQIQVQQNFDLHVANEPLKNMQLAVREDAADFQVFVDGNLTSVQLVGVLDSSPPTVPDDTGAGNPSDAAEEAAADAGQSWQVYQLLGAPDLLGASRVSTKTRIDWEPAETEDAEPELATSKVKVPLVRLLLPRDTRKLRQDWVLSTDTQVEAVSTATETSPQDVLATGQRVQELGDDQHEIDLSLRFRQVTASVPIRIGRSWLQTAITDNQRRDRFVVRLETLASELKIKLPTLAIIRGVSVDGWRIEQPSWSYDSTLDSLTILIPSDGTPQEHVIEISYKLPADLALATCLDVTPPQIFGADQYDRFYWQLVTPSVQHLGWSPGQLTEEWTWRWGGLWWQRHSPWDQASLEQLTGATGLQRLPLSANRYVMSGRGPVGTLRVWVLSRFVLWFPVGVVAIAIAVLVLNIAFFRQPIFAFALAGVVASLAMVWPDLAILVGQTAIISLGLVALVLATQAAVESRVRRRSVFTTRPSTYVEPSDYFSVSRGVRISQPATTQARSSVVADGDR